MTEVCIRSKRYSEEFKVKAAKQVLEHDRSLREVVVRLAWIRCVAGCAR